MVDMMTAGGHGSPAPTAPPVERPGGESAAGRQRWSPARWAYAFYATAATGAVIGQVWVALTHVPWSPGWPGWARIAAVLPFALCLELLGMATAAMADQRQQLGERAYGFRALSGVTAVTAVGVIVVGHWPHGYQVAGFGALSGSAYVLWLLHSAARRRDALRAAGLLAATAPAYGWWRRLRHPVVTARAAELARERGLDLYGSLRQAELDRRAEARRPAIAAAVEQVVRADHADPRMAEIAATTLDLDRIAGALEARADYAGWADRLAPAVLACPDIGAVSLRPRADIAPRVRADVSAAKPARRSGRTRGGQAGTVADRIAVVLTADPDITRAELAKQVGTSVRHVRRVLADRSGRTSPAGADTGTPVRADLAAAMSAPGMGDTSAPGLGEMTAPLNGARPAR
jgi:hypothetical protein